MNLVLRGEKAFVRGIKAAFDYVECCNLYRCTGLLFVRRLGDRETEGCKLTWVMCLMQVNRSRVGCRYVICDEGSQRRTEVGIYEKGDRKFSNKMEFLYFFLL